MATNWQAVDDLRHRWVKAYYQGDSDFLECVEAPFFFAKCGGRLTSKQQQLDALRAGMNHGLALAEIDDVIEARDHGSDWLTVKGEASVTLQGDAVGRYRYFEMWILMAGEWRITSLCFEQI
ncbi:hypothetical protein [Salinicola rhizosphaerae]|uniref:Nuclear transport factor 2 family protein n=1 Tax=Salinicola rhizosphaerae TaxID=1443141 RepID=A0ABQ3DYJ1_9GAMM|nr:hypothetical protein [Salinicola rhizosphaerae]GHB19872.1 hypothetical protein GCM10009038_18230 [Salinicola rhizosphaerae]